jgi:hypothetical protein
MGKDQGYYEILYIAPIKASKVVPTCNDCTLKIKKIVKITSIVFLLRDNF